MELHLNKVEVGDSVYLVPQFDPFGKKAVFIPRELHNFFALHNILWTPAREVTEKYFDPKTKTEKVRTLAHYPAGFRAENLPKYHAILDQWQDIVRQAQLAAAFKAAKIDFEIALKGYYGDIPPKDSIRKRGFIDRIKYLSEEARLEEVLSVLQFCNLLRAYYAKDQTKIRPLSWIESILAKKKKNEARFTKFIPTKCMIQRCEGRYSMIERIGRVLTFRCNICHDTRKRKLVRSRKQEEKSIGKTHDCSRQLE